MQYLLILAADILLAAYFSAQNGYQAKAGTKATATVTFNAFVGLFTGIIFTALGLFGAFRFEFSLFSLLMSALATLVGLCTMILGFKVMRTGNMPLYTMFLMTGGMLVPYVFGLGFLEERFSLLRLLGIILIVAAVVISNTGAKKPDAKQILMCCAVFLLNGAMSVISKVHQAPVSAQLSPVNTESYIVLMSAVRIVLCFPIVFYMLKKDAKNGSGTPLSRLMHFFILAAVFDGASYYLQLIGAKDIPAGVLYPLVTAGSIIFSAFAAMMVFRQKPTRNQWIAMAVCLAGTCLFI